MTVGNVTFHLGTHPSEQRVFDYQHDVQHDVISTA